MIKCISDVNLVDFKEWESFVDRHPYGTIFQTPIFFKAIESTKLYQCIPMFIFRDNKLIGILLAILQKEHSGIMGMFSSRAIVIGGPIIENNDQEVAFILLNYFINALNKKAIYSQFRNLFNAEVYFNAFKSNGYNFENHLNFIIDLRKKTEVLWSEVHPKRRNEIKRSKKEGVSFEEISGENAITDTYPILNEIYKKIKLPLPSRNYFIVVYNTLGSKIFKVFVARYDDIIIGAMYTLCFKQTIYDWYAGSYRSFYNKYPNDLLPWEIFLWGKENGYWFFDFGGAGKPEIPYGVRDYKEKFGGERVNYGRYEKVHRPILIIFSRIGLQLWKRLR